MKRIVAISILFSILSALFAQQFSIYKSETIKAFPVDVSVNSFLLDWESTEPNGPTAIGFNAEGDAYISDPIKSRLVVLDQAFTITSVHEQLYSEYVRNILISNSNIFSYNDFYMLCDKAFEKSFFINLKHTGSSLRVAGTIVDFSVIGALVIIHNQQGVLYSILNPGTDPAENNRRMLNTAQTRALFDNPSAHGLDSVMLDNKNRLFVRGELVTRSYEAFLTYHMEKRGVAEVLQYCRLSQHKYQAITYKGNGLSYIGRDNNKNWYWFTSGYLSIFSDNGLQIDLINLNNNSWKTTPAIHPSGDIYFLDYKEPDYSDQGFPIANTEGKEVFVKRIQNVWDPAGREAWYAAHPESSAAAKQLARITSGNVRVRSQPNLQGAQLGYVQTNDMVEILERSAEKMVVQDMNNYWYKIRKPDGMEGWVYGEFVELKN